MRVLVVEGLTRKDVVEMVGSFQSNIIKEAAGKNSPRKQRTKMYFQILQISASSIQRRSWQNPHFG